MPALLETIRHTTDEYENYDPKSENDTKSESDESTVISHAPSEQPSTDPTQNHGNMEESHDYFKVDYVLGDELINEKLNINSDAQETTGNVQIQKHRQEYLHWHSKLGHISHGRMKQLIENRKLPKYLNLKTPPMCIACLSGKATRKPWRTKSVNASSNKTTYPGKCVAIDQLESSTAGFIGQLRGSILTNQRYRYATCEHTRVYHVY